MVVENRFEKDFNEVENMTAICRQKSSWLQEYPELEIGKTYKVTHIGVFRSSTQILLEGFGHKDYNPLSFDLYENDVPLGHEYTRDFRFLAPYLKERIKLLNPVRYAELMKEGTICARLHKIEKEYEVRVLFAVPTGSRAWGLEAANSDWDVSYLYIHRPEWYKHSEGCRHLIERVFDDDIDTHGWELRDALSHLETGNPTILEWLNTNTSYLVKTPLYKRLKEISREHFNPVKALQYYYQAYIKLNEPFLQENGNLKEFLYYLRGVLACKWVESKSSVPPTDYIHLLENTVDEEDVRSKVNELVRLKKSGKCYDDIKVDADLIETVKQWAMYYGDLAESQEFAADPVLSEMLDSLYNEMILQYN